MKQASTVNSLVNVQVLTEESYDRFNSPMLVERYNIGKVINKKLGVVIGNSNELSEILTPFYNPSFGHTPDCMIMSFCHHFRTHTMQSR